MREIIEFITNNFFFVVIVVGFIFSLFSKMKKGEPNRRMPDFGGGGTPGMNRPRPAAADRQPRDEPMHQERPVITTSYHDAWEEVEDRESASQTSFADRVPARPAPARSLPPVSTSGEGARERDRHPLNLSDRNELAKAVLIAEILGPPRAKKPFGRR